ncbi:MAG: L,D-transpeptidase family protein [Alphaproteobacteria bacterium]
MLIIVNDNQLILNNKVYKCAFGKNGFTENKQEGDNKTPIGKWKLNRLFYRADKIDLPQTKLPTTEINENMGWCDDVKSDKYNQLVELPFDYSHEKMYRGDDVYDIVIELDYNIKNPVKGNGSAIFFHIAKPDYTGTEGCIAINLNDMLEILPYLDNETIMEIKG